MAVWSKADQTQALHLGQVKKARTKRGEQILTRLMREERLVRRAGPEMRASLLYMANSNSDQPELQLHSKTPSPTRGRGQGRKKVLTSETLIGIPMVCSTAESCEDAQHLCAGTHSAYKHLTKATKQG